MKKNLNSPCGGVLVSQLIAPQHPDGPIVPVDSVIESDFINLATGVYSPLEGFIDQKNLLSICEKNTLADRPQQTWTIPITFDVTEEQARELKSAYKIFLSSTTTKQVFGYVEPAEIYRHPKKERIEGVFKVDSDDHPGVKRVRQMGDYLVAGKVFLFENYAPIEGTPFAIRKKLSEKGLGTVAGFQTRNVVHRAHEYLQRTALEVCDGLLVHPVVGWKKLGDFKPEVVEHTYKKFIESYYPQERVVLSFLRVAMNYAGPKEAVFHALIRKNFGCSHFIVGRDHAGVGGFYGTYAAHEIFDSLAPLGIQILRLREPFYCEKCRSIATDKTCGHAEKDRDFISGTRIRKILSTGSDPSGNIFRPEVLASLKPFEKEGYFYE